MYETWGVSALMPGMRMRILRDVEAVMHVNILRNCKISSLQILFGFTLQSYYMWLGWSHLTAAVCHQVHKGNEILCIPTPSKRTTYAHMDVHVGACEMGMGEGATKRLGPISLKLQP